MNIYLEVRKIGISPSAYTKYEGEQAFREGQKVQSGATIFTQKDMEALKTIWEKQQNANVSAVS